MLGKKINSEIELEIMCKLGGCSKMAGKSVGPDTQRRRPRGPCWGPCRWAARTGSRSADCPRASAPGQPVGSGGARAHGHVHMRHPFVWLVGVMGIEDQNISYL